MERFLGLGRLLGLKLSARGGLIGKSGLFFDYRDEIVAPVGNPAIWSASGLSGARLPIYIL